VASRAFNVVFEIVGGGLCNRSEWGVTMCYF
jgi:hypothetical protein